MCMNNLDGADALNASSNIMNKARRESQVKVALQEP